jgi:hypothetical protein
MSQNVNNYDAVDPETFNPQYGTNAPKPGHQDKTSGGILSVDRVKVANTDSIDAHAPVPTALITREWSVTNTFQPCIAIDCAGYSRIFAGIEVTGASGANAYAKVAWSPDGVSWWYESHEVMGTPAGTEVVVFKYSIYDQFLATGTGIKTEAQRSLPVRARYFRMEFKTSSGTLTGKIHVQLL